MNEHIQKFNEKLSGHFEIKAEEFNRRTEENPAIAQVTAEIAGLYRDLAKVMRS
ncbi:MAG TPA: hypothetical protein V6C81_02000 [Planktothrix sp.]|jgi:hypothetical protein